MKLEFEWHKAKAKDNFRRHGVSFDLAKTVFQDPFAIERLVTMTRTTARSTAKSVL